MKTSIRRSRAKSPKAVWCPDARPALDRRLPPLSYSGSSRTSAGTMILAFLFAVAAAAMIAAPMVRAAVR